MSFLQPWLLWALPLAALPVIIHLISQRRHRVLHWAAMMFLLDARRATKGLARIRQWLILALRVLALLLFILAVSRPLMTSGQLGWGGLDAVFIVLDRSASMEQTGDAGVAKRETGLRRVASYLKRVGSVRRVVLLDSATGAPLEIDDPDSLLNLPQTGPADARADIPSLLEHVQEIVEADQVGAAEVWVISDLQPDDWDAGSGRWGELRRQFSALERVSLRLLAFDRPPQQNFAVRVDNVRVEPAGRSRYQLVLDVRVRQTGRQSTRGFKLPLEFVVDGVRTRYPIEITGTETSVSGIALPIESEDRRGWGYAELPGDDRPSDNRFYFAYAPPSPRRTAIVAEDARVAQFLKLATEIPNDPEVSHESLVVTPDRVNEVNWDETALLIWQAPLPTGEWEQKLREHLAAGRTIVFLPPLGAADDTSFAGVTWGDWQELNPDGDESRVGQWQTKSGLLANDQAGEPLPLDELIIARCRKVVGNTLPSARLTNGLPLLLRPTAPGATRSFFLCTLPRAEESNLADERIVIYVLLQRALARGAAQLSDSIIADAGSPFAERADRAKRVFPSAALPAMPASHVAGVYGSGRRLVALNRPETEDRITAIADERLNELFAGTQFAVIHDEVDRGFSLAREIWRGLLLAMLVALVAEAALSLPPKREPSTVLASGSSRPARLKEVA